METPWVPFSLTYVEYPKGDLIGKFLALFSLLPIFIVIGFVTLIGFRRDLHTVTFFIGLLLDEIVNMIIKNVVRQPRPLRAADSSHLLHNEYGMPSNHSQFMGFFSTYLVLFVYLKIVSDSSLIRTLWKHLICFGTISVAGLVGFSRLYLQYHTPPQILCGFFVGFLTGCIWFAFTDFCLKPYFPSIVAQPLCEYLMIRDCTRIPNILWFEYSMTRGEARRRERKSH
ncbi:dolichyldiphosphatase 1-like [Oscarella lobularis]|uniref:dolichyldiphosphatase 1-like n=1 Tax=Oscarella lobularis TaxID=121494 RepID=UPI003313DB84